MFERGKIDNRHGEAEKTPYAVELTLQDGKRVSGRLHVLVTRALGDELNAQGGFLEFETYDGERTFVSKQSVVAVRSLAAPKADQIARAERQFDSLDPHAILHVAAGADRDQIRAAYHRMAKLYHPDRFAGLDLPAEVADYVSAVARRVNIAYAALQPVARVQEEAPRRAG